MIENRGEAGVSMLVRIRLSLGGGIIGSALTGFWSTSEAVHLTGAALGIILSASVMFWRSE